MTRPICDIAFLFAGQASQPFGHLPRPSEIMQIADVADVLVVMHHGLYTAGDGTHGPYPPWTPTRLREFRRFVATCQGMGLPVAPYTSMFNGCARYGTDYTPNRYICDVGCLLNETGAAGVFVDGLCFPYNGNWYGKPEWNLAVMSRLRELVGDGPIVYHCTASNGQGGWRSPEPAAERLATVVVRGELGDGPFNSTVIANYLAQQLMPTTRETALAVAPINGWPEADRTSRLIGLWASGFLCVQMRTDPSDGHTRFSCQPTAELNALRKARAIATPH